MEWMKLSEKYNRHCRSVWFERNKKKIIGQREIWGVGKKTILSSCINKEVINMGYSRKNISFLLFLPILREKLF